VSRTLMLMPDLSPLYSGQWVVAKSVYYIITVEKLL